MRNLIFSLLLFPLLVFAQKREIFRIDSLPKEGVLLNQGWKWHAGDNPEWAKAESDDSNWKLMPPLDVMDSLPQNFRTSGIRWLRLKLKFDKSLSKEILALAIDQIGASEIYMNGKSLKRYGVVSSNPDEVKAFNPLLDPIPFAVSKDSMVVLAVRYTYQNNIRKYLPSPPNLIGLTITVNNLELIQSSKMLYLTRHYDSNTFRVGAFFILFISYFALYFYNPVHKANLFLCLFSLTILIADLIQLKYYNYHWIEESTFFITLFFFLLAVGKILLLTAVCFLMNQKINWLFGLLSGLILLSYFLFIVIGYHLVLIFLIVHIFPNLINLEIIRITLKAIQSQKKGAWIIALGGIVFLISVVFFVFMVYFNFIDMPLWGSVQTVGDLVYNVSWLSIPLAVAIYFGQEVALNNRSLKEKLTEVEQLSAEKQLILATQNETLEHQVAERTTELSSKNRELEIEAALERVRSRTMAMQNSDELREAANLLSHEVRGLGIPVWSCGYNIMQKGEKSCIGWMSTEGSIQPSFKIPLEVSPTFIRFYESRQKGELFYEEQIGGIDLKKHYDYMMTLPDFKKRLQHFLDAGYQLPTFQVNNVVNFSNGNLIFITAQPVPQGWDIFKRFAIVFEQTFTRFLDLQNKEEQGFRLVEEKKRLEITLTELRATQAQLIQSEKLASLGELTAGIAHEIQNPLNFVNNFAEVSEEMLGEMEEELDKGDTQEAKAIAADLKQNLSKINHHGQRASAIVKGMLEHSRASTGVKAPTDLNALADEYLRLAYHGLRAKDNNFNATMETHLDPDLPLVSVIPQDIGRVLLNLINNAFYAINEKARMGIEGYQPNVTVSSSMVGDKVEIRVQDNGNGIPESIRDKIFQPFFTTKPTGQGTGLGLSLAYDIVTKGHGGTLEVKNTAGESAAFLLQLPLKNHCK